MRRWWVIIWALVVTFGTTPAVNASTASSPSASAAVPSNLTLVSNVPSGQPVGATITWTASAQDSSPLEYRFSMTYSGKAAAVVRDFEPSPSFTWTPIVEGSYTVQVSVEEVGSTNLVTLSSGPYAIVSRVVGTLPVLTATSNPLVYLYSVPPCKTTTGSVGVLFGFGTRPLNYFSTPTYPCVPGKSANFYLEGLKPNTAYTAQYFISIGTTGIKGPKTAFTTGSLPSSLVLPSITVPIAVSAAASVQNPVVFHDTAGSGGSSQSTHMFATDVYGNVLWYLNNPIDPTHQSVEQPLSSGGILALFGDSQGPNQLVRIIDPLGNPLVETTLGRINEQLAQIAPPQPGATTCPTAASGQTVCQISQLHHEVDKLPNGHIILIGYVEQLSTQAQGGTPSKPVDILGDEIVDLNSNLQVDWTWNTFDGVPISQMATLGDTCTAGQTGCPIALQLGSQANGIANDWTHTNAVVYSAADHNLIVSLRNQDQIVKLAYGDAGGDGSAVWTLGNSGSFSLSNPPSGGATPWFSHQNGLEVMPNGSISTSIVLATFDNGNGRCTSNGIPIPGCDSRGQVYQLDQSAMVATQTVNADLGSYSSDTGWAQTLLNGDYSFTNGDTVNAGVTTAQDEEWNSTGSTETYALQESPALVLRTYRMPTMYSGCCGD